MPAAPSYVWTHVVLVQDGNAPYAYVNGVQAQITWQNSVDRKQWFKWALMDATTKANTFTIGALRRNGGLVCPQQGAVDEFRVYNRVLSTNEITALYKAGR